MIFKRVPYYLSLYIYLLFIFNKWIIVLAFSCLLFFTLFHLLCVPYPSQEGIIQWTLPESGEEKRKQKKHRTGREGQRKEAKMKMLFLKDLKIIHCSFVKCLNVCEQRSTFKRICSKVFDIFLTLSYTNGKLLIFSYSCHSGGT